MKKKELIKRINNKLPIVIEKAIGTATAILILYSFIHIINHFIS